MKTETALELERGAEIYYGSKLKHIPEAYNPLAPLKLGIWVATNPRWGIVMRVFDDGGVVVSVIGPEDKREKRPLELIRPEQNLKKTGRKFANDQDEGKWFRVEGDEEFEIYGLDQHFKTHGGWPRKLNKEFMRRMERIEIRKEMESEL